MKKQKSLSRFSKFKSVISKLIVLSVLLSLFQMNGAITEAAGQNPRDYESRSFDSQQPKDRLKRTKTSNSINSIQTSSTQAPMLMNFSAQSFQATSADTITFKGEGTPEKPYQIEDEDQLNEVRNRLDKNFELVSNIDLGSYPNWDPIGIYNDDLLFTGTFNGNNHSISNLKVDEKTKDAGLFSAIGTGGKIENVTLINAEVTGDNFVGGLAGYIVNGEISNVKVSGSITGNDYVGGLIGTSDNTIVRNSSTDSSVTATGHYVGGLIGDAYFGNYSGNEVNVGEIQNSFAEGMVISTFDGTGDPYFDNHAYLGGLVGGLSETYIIDSYSTSSVSNTGENSLGFVGGLVGSANTSIIKSSDAAGEVSGNTSIGGLVGYAKSSEIEHSLAMGNVSGYSEVGGLVGALELSTLSNTFASSTVIDKTSAYDEMNYGFGGLVGSIYSKSTIDKSFAVVEVQGTSSVGGLIGFMDAYDDGDNTITNSFAVGKAEGKYAESYGVGGLIGEIWGSNDSYSSIINQSYSASFVSDSNEAGGLIGGIWDGQNDTSFDNVTINDSYYDTNIAGKSDTGKGEPKTSEEMTNPATFTNWDFQTIWGRHSTYFASYPYLRWTGKLSDDASLNALSLTGIALSETFSPSQLNYTATAPNNISYVTVTGTALYSNPTVTYKLNDQAVTNPISLAVGANVISIVVKSEDETATKTYTVTITRQPASNSDSGNSGGGGSTGSNPTTPANQENTEISVTRSIQNGQKVDQININEAKGLALINEALNKKQNTLTIDIPASKENPADQVVATLSKETLARLTDNNLSVTIQANDARISIPTDTLGRLNQDVSFTIEQVSETDELKETDSVISMMAPDGTKLGTSLRIETNYQGKTEVTLPLAGINLPKDPEEQKAFLASLGVLVQHGKDDNEVITGAIVYDTNNQPIGLSFSIDRFSTFTLLSLPAKEKETTQPLSVSFPDINGHWAEKEIQALVSKGIIKGFPDGSFKANNQISRAEFASITVKALGLTCEQGKAFADTTGHWAKDCISTAVANGIVTGMETDKFAPNDPITREQMAVIISRAAKLEVQDISTAFKDEAQISAWAKPSVAAAAKQQIVGGLPNGTFNPKGKATRAEAVVMMTRLLK